MQALQFHVRPEQEQPLRELLDALPGASYTVTRRWRWFSCPTFTISAAPERLEDVSKAVNAWRWEEQSCDAW